MTSVRFDTFFPSEVRAFVTSREMDFVLPPEAVGLTSPQKDYLKSKENIDPSHIFTIRQVHADQVLVVSDRDLPQAGALPLADGVVTNSPGVVLTVRTADCLPVFLYDPVKKCAGLIHAGWRSSAEKILVKAIQSLENRFGTHSPDLLVAFGPAIRSCCYEVGEEFRDVFPHEVSVHQHRGTLHLDLPLVNKHQLMTFGVKARNIHDPQLCTVCGTGFFSYRRDQHQAGRHLSVMMIKK